MKKVKPGNLKMNNAKAREHLERAREVQRKQCGGLTPVISGLNNPRFMFRLIRQSQSVM